MKVFIFGATGFLGRNLVCKLIRNGISVSILTRDKKRAEAILDQDAVIFVGDMVAGTYPELSEYDVVINCAGEIKNKSLMRYHILCVMIKCNGFRSAVSASMALRRQGLFMKKVHLILLVSTK